MRLARERLAGGRLPVDLNDCLEVGYSSDVDLLTIRFKENPRPTRTDDDLDAGIIYNFEKDRLVSLEILDITGKYADAA